MERRNLALLCAGVVCFWLFALAFGTAQGKGLRIQPVVQAQAEPAVQTLTVTPPQLTLPCRAAILIDQTSGAVLYEMNADQTMPIASITKVMTLLLTFEAVHAGRLTMDTAVPVSEHAYHMGGSQIWLEPGEQFTLDEMLKAICVSSANDAAVAVAELVGGSEPAFVQQMNARAAELGMEHTTFRNACGLDTEGHLSTARDVAIMSRTILNTCPEVLHYTGIWTDTLRGGQTQLVNTNKLLRRYNGITGSRPAPPAERGVHYRQRHPGRAEPHRGGAGCTLQQGTVRSRHHPAGLRLCGLPRRTGAPAAGAPAAIKGKGQHRGDRAAGLRRSAADRVAARRKRRTADRAAGTARHAGSPGDPGTDGGQGAAAVRRSSTGGVPGVRCRRCAVHGFWHRLAAAVGQPAGDSSLTLCRKRRFSAQKCAGRPAGLLDT